MPQVVFLPKLLVKGPCPLLSPLTAPVTVSLTRALQKESSQLYCSFFVLAQRQEWPGLSLDSPVSIVPMKPPSCGSGTAHCARDDLLSQLCLSCPRFSHGPEEHLCVAETGVS